jgi:hypothetical protein
MKNKQEESFMVRVLRYTLGTLLAFLALNAFGGGYYAMTGAEGVPVDWLQGSPFTNYFYPGIILFAVVGGGFLLASIAVFSGYQYATYASYAAVMIVAGWLIVQVAIIGYVSWMQPATAITSLIILLLTWTVHKYHRVAIR